jgi:protein-S-isoprenylcysteine O-methyltransferase Ste14
MIPMHSYGYIIVASWLVLMTVWVIGAFTAKRDASSRSKTLPPLLLLFLLGLLIYALTRNLQGDAFILERAFFNFGLAVSWVGTLLTVIGVAFAIWGRYDLGRDWGIHPKEDHKLVTSGAYAYVRHPIYSGAMLALFGSALTGSIVAVVLFIISIFFCLRRIKNEERAMLNLFPEQYQTYQACTKRVIPFVW